MSDITIPEPGDRAMVAWMNGGVPVAVYVRIDDYAEAGAPLYRWFAADEDRGAGEGPERWSDLHTRMFQAQGPYLLNVGELLGGTDGKP
jgi:hypothetical protein